MDRDNSEMEQSRKRRRWRWRFDWLKAEWSPTAGLTVTGVGIGAIVILVVSLTAGHHTRAEPSPDPTDGPVSTTPTTSVMTTTPTRATTTTERSRSRILNSTSQSTSTTTQPTSRTPDPVEPLVQLNEQWVELDPAQTDCTKGVRFNFFQKIAVTRAGTLTYRWERDDNAIQTEPSEVTFSGPGTKVLTTYWIRGGQPGDQITGKQWIHITSPIQLDAKDHEFGFDYMCPASSARPETPSFK